MDVLFLCGVFAKENEAEVIAQAKKSVEFSANQMQLKLISGLKEVADTQVISAPFIGRKADHCIQRTRSVSSGSSLCQKAEPKNQALLYCSRSSAIYEPRSKKRFSL